MVAELFPSPLPRGARLLRAPPASAMAKVGGKRIDFEINFTRMKWVPKHLSELPQVVSRAFERDISMSQIAPLVGTDHIKEWPLKEDKDIAEFHSAPTMMREWIAEKLVKVKIPDGCMPKDFAPKKVKILAKGAKIAKFFGEDTCSTRNVECSLKLFDCHHFYLKQTLPGTGASPHWTIFEGRWHPTERGIRLEYLLRYTWQLSRKPGIEFSIEATKPELQSSLAWDGETERQLNGNLPAVVGTDDFFWVELVREGDMAGVAKIRWNEDCPEPPSWTKRGKDGPDGSDDDHGRTAAGSAAGQAVAPAAAAPAVPGPAAPAVPAAPAAGAPAVLRPAVPADAAAASSPAAAAEVPTWVPPRPKAAAQLVPQDADTESPWPLYVGFAIFVLMAALFLFSNTS